MARADRLSAWGVALAQTIHTWVNAQVSPSKRTCKITIYFNGKRALFIKNVWEITIC